MSWLSFICFSLGEIILGSFYQMPPLPTPVFVLIVEIEPQSFYLSVQYSETKLA